MDAKAKIERITAVARAFTPGAPVGRLDMLAGRMAQMTDVVSAVWMRGQHVGLYGERGVGKTSLASVLAEYFSDTTRSARKDALFSEVLLACALAPIPAFSNHLSQFLEPKRGAVLQREGSSRRYFYRSRTRSSNPMWS